MQAPGTASRDFSECFILMDEICFDNGLLGLVCRRVSGRGGLIWGGERVGVGRTKARK